MEDVLKQIFFIFWNQAWIRKMGIVLLFSIILGESLCFSMGFLINGRLPKKTKKHLLKNKGAILSLLICPYIYITYELFEAKRHDIREFGFIFLMPLGLTVHIFLMRWFKRYISKKYGDGS